MPSPWTPQLFHSFKFVQSCSFIWLCVFSAATSMSRHNAKLLKYLDYRSLFSNRLEVSWYGVRGTPYWEMLHWGLWKGTFIGYQGGKALINSSESKQQENPVVECHKGALCHPCIFWDWHAWETSRMASLISRSLFPCSFSVHCWMPTAYTAVLHLFSVYKPEAFIPSYCSFMSLIFLFGLEMWGPAPSAQSIRASSLLSQYTRFPDQEIES